MSAREAAIAALHDAVAAALALRNPAPLTLRGETVPQRLPPGGLAMVQDGETAEETPIVSPLRFQVRHVAEVVLVAPGPSPQARAALLDALLVDVAAAVVADRTLGGAVEWAQPEAPFLDVVEFEGASAARTASVPVSLWFTAADTPLS
ncbi:hypothetical protein [Elioraea sp.]|uniref:hypothetical protein n=1 Tax=Elioraea sp. TaxID=2185103 RepID=UPI0021DCECF2|nr:hypothetical protein [Elioraea sp.]GIX10374.1 MAG: hypothetical protein KatS3mg116_2084 [Elioraea sp.]